MWESHPSQHDPESGFWKFLCIVLDNEALGLLERLLTANGLRHKIGADEHVPLGRPIDTSKVF